MEIAVLVDSSGKTSSFEKNGIVNIYSHTKGEWVIKRSMIHTIEDKNNSRDLRKCLTDLCTWLEDCEIMVVKRIRGIQYIVFEEFKVSMLQIEDYPKNFLDYIKQCEHHTKSERKSSTEHIAIFEQKPGSFYVDMRDVMNGKTSYSSKQILLPFFKGTSFEVLEMLCDHVPKWFENELPRLKLIASVEQFKDCVKIRVCPEPLRIHELTSAKE